MELLREELELVDFVGVRCWMGVRCGVGVRCCTGFLLSAENTNRISDKSVAIDLSLESLCSTNVETSSCSNLTRPRVILINATVKEIK